MRPDAQRRWIGGNVCLPRLQGLLWRCPALVALGLATASVPGQSLSETEVLPDAPSFLLISMQQQGGPPVLPAPAVIPLCDPPKAKPGSPESKLTVEQQGRELNQPCVKEENPLQSIVMTPGVRPLTSSQKGLLAIHDVLDPFSLVVLTASAGVGVATNAHGVYGPGLKGWGSATGYSLAIDVQGEFFGTFAIPALTHEDPRYHRMPGRPIWRRTLHAAVHTFVSQHDDGSLMPNYATLLNYPISIELSNLYVPGSATNGSATAERIVLGIATDPENTLLGEFLPDVAKHVHVHFVFAQQLINRFAQQGPSPPTP